MRTYGSIQTCFWGSTETRQLSDQAKLLITYLQTSPHTTMLGCFRLPVGYIESDLGWDCDKVNYSLDELNTKDLILYDQASSWLLIPHFLKFNPVCNPRQGMCIQKLFDAVPPSSVLFKPLINSLLTYGKFMLSTFTDRLHHLNKSVETVKSLCSTEQEQDQEQDQEQNKKIDMSNPEKQTASESLEQTYLTQAKSILDFLNEKTGRVYRQIGTNLKFIVARLKSGATVMDCRQVIAKKTREWKDNPVMAEYLRPATLFNPVKFEQYLGELVVPKEETSNA